MPAPVKPAEVDIKPLQRDPTPIRILAADDQEHILEALDLLLRPQGYRVDKVRSPAVVREALSTTSYDAVLIDLNYTRDTTSGQEGLDLLSEIVGMDATIPVIVMTAWANVELAVEAMRRGARDFVQKPWENDRLITILRTQVELHRALQHAARLEAENRLLRAEGRPEFLATAPAMQPVLDTIARVGPSDANVLITGEHGTGKEVVAQTLHALSARSSRPLVAVNTGAIPDGVFESSCSGMSKAHSPMLAQTALDVLSWRMAAPFSLMRSGMFQFVSRPSYYAFSSQARSNAWAPHARAGSMCACCRRPTPISPPHARQDSSVKICCFA